MSLSRSSYGLGEIRWLVEGYTMHYERRDTTETGLRYVIALEDLRRAIRRLPDELWQALVAYGIAGMTYVAAAGALQVSERAIRTRYADALKHLHWTLNGGSY